MSAWRGEEDPRDDARGPAPDAEDAGEWSVAGPADPGAGRGLALGFLAMLPLFAAYELALRGAGGALRNAAELVCFRALAPVDDALLVLRPAALGLATVAALVVCFRRRVAIGPGCLRIFLEGLLGAVLLGPALALSMRALSRFSGELHARPGPPPDPPELYEAGFAFGGAAYEELVFRVLAFGLGYLLVVRGLGFLGAAGRGARWSAEGVALALSSLAFAAFHLRAFNGWLGAGGEEFRPAVFTWRLLAGMLLCLLFRWRGPGVAAWTHGLFNLALVLGAGPEILL